MKARVVKKDGQVLLLCNDGTISVSSNRLMKKFLSLFTDCSTFSGNDGTWTELSLDMGEFPGTTLAYVTDQGALVVLDPTLFSETFSDTVVMSDYITIDEFAEKYDRSPSLIKAFIRDGRIPGAIRFGRQWAIPMDAPYPVETHRLKPNSGQRAAD